MTKSPDLQKPANAPDNVAGNINPPLDASQKSRPDGEAKISRDPSKISPTPLDLSSLLHSTQQIPSRAGTLSWQQRPTSRGSIGARASPLSQMATEDNATKALQATSGLNDKDEKSMSKTRIARSLESKDPAWFRQTEDRGTGSAAYRRNQEDSMVEASSIPEKMKLPGLSPGPSDELGKELNPPPQSVRSTPTSVAGSIHGSSNWDHKLSSSASASSTGGVRSPLPILKSQRFEPPSSDVSSTSGVEISTSIRALAMSPAQGRISPERLERPSSPTKGLGGFVQSAMLKRSDSVNKRWTAHAGPGLSRGNSVSSNKSGYDGSKQGTGNTSPTRELRPKSPSRENSPLLSSRPTSSHANAVFSGFRTENERPKPMGSLMVTKTETGDSGFVKPRLPPITRTPFETEAVDIELEGGPGSKVPPSPSKKWSPAKASWLESAIQKPDSPKLKASAPHQPSWMANISKARQDRLSIDLGKSDTARDFTAEGLSRSSPPGSLNKPQTFGGASKYLNARRATQPKDKCLDEATFTKELENPKVAEDPKSDPDAVDRSKMFISAESLEIGRKSALLKSTPPKTVFRDVTPVKVPPLTNRCTIPSGSNSPSFPDGSPSNFKPQSTSGSPSSTGFKPETPRKKDFRSTLKPRQASIGKEDKEEAEFKNVFGKLKRTQTQNYIAPDELKENILRGKAGLAATGGPKKTDRKDDFKESLLKQKEAMKAAPPIVPRKPSDSFAKGQASPIPEAIAKRNTLSRSESGTSSIAADNRGDLEKSLVLSEGFPDSGSLQDKSMDAVPKKYPSAPQKASTLSGKAGDKFGSSLAGFLLRGPSPTASGAKLDAPMNPSVLAGDAPTSNVKDDSSANGPQLVHLTKTRARGPKRRLPAAGAVDSSTTEPGSLNPGPEAVSAKPTLSKGNITGRLSPISHDPRVMRSRPLSNISNNNRKPSQPPSPRKPSSNVVVEEAKPATLMSMAVPKYASSNPSKVSPLAKPKPLSIITDQQSQKSSCSPDGPLHTPSGRLFLVGESISSSFSAMISQKGRQQPNRENERSFPSVKGAVAHWINSPKSGSPSSTTSPAKVSTRDDNDKEVGPVITNNASADGKHAFTGLGIQESSSERPKPASLDPNLPSPPLKPLDFPKSPKSPPLLGKKPAFMASRVSSSVVTSSVPEVVKAPTTLSTESSNLLGGYFGRSQDSDAKVSIDTQSIVASRSSNDGFDKIKTLRKQIWEVTGNGKFLSLPSHQEHILYEERLYICTHVFGTLAGTRTTETYLWVGSEVAQSAAEDAQLFGRRVAKDNNSKLLVLPQGKETPNFFQALGGIVIIRRGASTHSDSPSKSSATYMLCGRRQTGQIAFDEVDFSAQSLCKGFPFIVSARFGKLYLWKGCGSGVDELGCARLIGMDLGLTGEIEEVDEGHEPTAFWEALSVGRKDNIVTSDIRYWNLKPSCEKYATRLFVVDVEGPQPKSSSSFNVWGRRGSTPQPEVGGLQARITEIVPYTQADVATEGFYVLDSFFEVFV